ncbi:MAG TPA: helix-turn-helix domain-containing protein [Anaerolineales bacterium]|nr:helix-turn-helix domain-containing protein [Anaerolineales bacterium]HRQ91810.1 helix-turn-helix domain-containing protein [Anaerolineales bacterium]
MSQDRAIQLRSKIIGVLLRDARLGAGKSLKQVADVIGLSSGTLSAVERGANSLSLPELELLAFYLRIPLAHFWSEDIVSQDVSPAETLQAESLLVLRHRTVAAMLRQGRNEKSLSQKELSDRTHISPSRIRRYESGETPVPLPELEALAAALGYSLDSFADSSGPVGQWITQSKAAAEFDELPRDLQEFLSNPENRYYLELARRLSDIPMERMRSLVDVLNSIVN